VWIHISMPSQRRLAYVVICGVNNCYVIAKKTWELFSVFFNDHESIWKSVDDSFCISGMWISHQLARVNCQRSEGTLCANVWLEHTGRKNQNQMMQIRSILLFGVMACKGKSQLQRWNWAWNFVLCTWSSLLIASIFNHPSSINNGWGKTWTLWNHCSSNNY
jgi:hypothetical protein